MIHPISQLRRLLFGRAQHEIVEQVHSETEKLRVTAVAVRERLDEYANAKDPFIAMLADIYERRQEAAIYQEALKDWRGPPR